MTRAEAGFKAVKALVECGRKEEAEALMDLLQYDSVFDAIYSLAERSGRYKVTLKAEDDAEAALL